MDDRVRQVMAWAPVAGLAALLVRAGFVWDRLPARMMSHFDAHGNPNGWMGKSEFFAVSLLLLLPVFVLLGYTAARVGRRKAIAGWALVAVTWLSAAMVLSVMWGAIDANLYQTRLNVVPIWILAVAMVPLVMAIGIDWRWWMSRQRREAAAEHVGPVQVIAEERHGSSGMALFMLSIAGVVTVLPLAALPKEARTATLWIVAVVGVVMLAAVYWAWRGFVYRFTNAGVEVRALGIKLRRIPLSQIKEFRAERVNPLTDFGGWGVKGFGSDTAYIWGGRTALHIKTHTGDVYLGHENPARLVRDLEALMSTAR